MIVRALHSRTHLTTTLMACRQGQVAGNGLQRASPARQQPSRRRQTEVSDRRGHSDAGWYLIIARGRDHRLIHESILKSLSVGCEVLTCTIEEQSEDAATDVVVEGDLPFAFSGIRSQFTALANADDADDALVDPMFEIPVECVRSLIDYKPYDKNPRFAGRYTLLEGLDTPWWKRWTVGG